MRIGTSMSTKRLDQACVDEYKIPLIVMMENAVMSALKHLDINLYDRYIVVSGVGNNGGDGLGIARQLKARNKNVEVEVLDMDTQDIDDLEQREWRLKQIQNAKSYKELL